MFIKLQPMRCIRSGLRKSPGRSSPDPFLVVVLMIIIFQGELVQGAKLLEDEPCKEDK